VSESWTELAGPARECPPISFQGLIRCHNCWSSIQLTPTCTVCHSLQCSILFNQASDFSILFTSLTLWPNFYKVHATLPLSRPSAAQKLLTLSLCLLLHNPMPAVKSSLSRLYKCFKTWSISIVVGSSWLRRSVHGIDQYTSLHDMLFLPLRFRDGEVPPPRFLVLVCLECVGDSMLRTPI